MINVKDMSIHIKDYQSCRGGKSSCTFIDSAGNSVEIDNETLYYMFRFMRHWLQQTDSWENFEEKMLQYLPSIDKL